VNDSIDKFLLRGLNAVVTGASSGLGRHFSSVLASVGATVFCCARRVDKLRATVETIGQSGGSARAVAMDVTDRFSVCAALDGVGRIDILVNNAGVADSKRPFDYTEEDWDTIIATNLTGAWMVAQESARRMVAAKTSGAIINITSVLASRVSTGVGPYSASKAGLKHLTQSMALEYARYKIRVNSIAPGFFVTDMNEEYLNSESGGQMKMRIPSRRFGTYEDLDGPLLLLASSAGAYMTGAEIVVDGGHLCSTL
jgi:NAD(P)-dependent dehydrogenase (short-subunit alcohol dehydrogenase family)